MTFEEGAALAAETMTEKPKMQTYVIQSPEGKIELVPKADHDRAMDALDFMAVERIARMRDERNGYAGEALMALAAAGVPTPEKGYVKDGGPGQMGADIRSLVKGYKELQAKRDEILMRAIAAEEERDTLRKQLQQAEQQRQTPSDNALFVEVMGRVRDRGFELTDALHQILAKGLGL